MNKEQYVAALDRRYPDPVPCESCGVPFKVKSWVHRFCDACGPKGRLIAGLLTRDEYIRLVREQDGKCALCRLPPVGRALEVDHDHDSGRVRGLLCRSCNVALGHFRDNPETLARAIEYLRGGE